MDSSTLIAAAARSETPDINALAIDVAIVGHRIPAIMAPLPRRSCRGISAATAISSSKQRMPSYAPAGIARPPWRHRLTMAQYAGSAWYQFMGPRQMIPHFLYDAGSHLQQSYAVLFDNEMPVLFLVAKRQNIISKTLEPSAITLMLAGIMSGECPGTMTLFPPMAPKYNSATRERTRPAGVNLCRLRTDRNYHLILLSRRHHGDI